MISEKIKGLITIKGKMISDFIPVLDVSSRQAISNKLYRNSFTLQDAIKLADYLNCEIVIKDKTTNKELICFDADDVLNVKDS